MIHASEDLRTGHVEVARKKGIDLRNGQQLLLGLVANDTAGVDLIYVLRANVVV